MPALGSVVANGFVESQVRGGIVADKNRSARRNATIARASRQTALYIYSASDASLYRSRAHPRELSLCLPSPPTNA